MALVLAKPTAARAGAEAPAAAVIDISTVRDKLVVLGDGRKHYVVLVPFGDMSEHVYWGDGKSFHALRVFGGGSSGDGKGADDSFDRVFWEPRVSAPYKGSLGLRARKYTVQCDERKTELRPLAADEAAKLIAGATFRGPRWAWRAYALARDNAGTYYYVDRAREPEGNRNFRLYVGPRGGLTPQKMVNVVSDSEGDIFATRSGSLRLVLGRRESTWIAGKKETKLLSLPVEDNHVLIYGDLGVYAGERLGTPCDDL